MLKLAGSKAGAHPAIIRFLNKIIVSTTRFYNNTPCWEWQARISTNGYGQFHLHGNTRTGPHRFAYEYFIGPVPEGKEPDHLCVNSICCSPFHLEAVTHQENIKRKYDRGYKQNCKRGHPFTAENTYTPPGTNKRKCKTCMKGYKLHH